MSILDNVKEIADLVKKVGDVELYRKIVELEGEVVELTRSKRTLEERVEELQDNLRFKGKLCFREPFYFAEGDSVPYCPRCWEVDKRAVHLVAVGESFRYDCTACKSVFLIER